MNVTDMKSPSQSNKKLSYCKQSVLQGALVLAKSGRMGLRDDILWTFSTTVT